LRSKFSTNFVCLEVNPRVDIYVSDNGNWSIFSPAFINSITNKIIFENVQEFDDISMKSKISRNLLHRF